MTSHFSCRMAIRPFATPAFLLAAVICARAQASPLTQAFTYQGQLVDDGAFADGTYAMEFKLFDAPEGGNRAGSSSWTGTVSKPCFVDAWDGQ